MQHSVHGKRRGPNTKPCWLFHIHGLQLLNLTLECDIIFYHTPTFVLKIVIIIKYMPERVLMENIFKIAVIYCNTSETRIRLLSALKYKNGVCNIFNCSCTQKRCLARSLSAVPHGQRVWLSDKPALLRRGILYFFPSVSPVFFPLPFQSFPISVKNAVTFSFFHFQIPTSHQLF